MTKTKALVVFVFLSTVSVIALLMLPGEDGGQPDTPTASFEAKANVPEAGDEGIRDKQREDLIQQELAKLGGEHYKPLKSYMDYPGLDEPGCYSVAEANLVDETPIIGVEYEGKAYAFVEERMEDPKAHVVNVNVGGKMSFSVTYCYLAECVRVFASEGPDLIPLGVGGLDEDDQLVLLQNGKRYGQTSEAIPLADYPHQRTSLGAWREVYPKTRVCIPPSRVSISHRRGRTG